MRFSILVPIYNVEKLLPACIESILNQTFCDFELILVVDGSPDNSENICNEYSLKDNRVKVIVKENGGPISARKVAVQHSSGDYVICVDGDDYIHYDLLSKLDSEISKHPSIDMIGFGYYEDCNQKISDPIFHKIPNGYYTDSSILKNGFLFDSTKDSENNGCLNFALWTKCFRRSLFAECQNQVPDTVKNGEDVLCTAWCISRITNFSIVNFAGYYYRSNDSSITHIRKPYDLINVTNVKNELQRISIFPKENIGHWYQMSYYVLLRDIAKCSKSYSEYKIFLQSMSYDPQYDGLRFYSKYKVHQRLKYYLIQKHRWTMLYLCVKMFRL